MASRSERPRRPGSPENLQGTPKAVTQAAILANMVEQVIRRRRELRLNARRYSTSTSRPTPTRAGRIIRRFRRGSTPSPRFLWVAAGAGRASTTSTPSATSSPVLTPTSSWGTSWKRTSTRSGAGCGSFSPVLSAASARPISSATKRPGPAPPGCPCRSRPNRPRSSPRISPGVRFLASSGSLKGSADQ